MKTIQMVIQSDVKLSFHTRLRVVVYENHKRADVEEYSGPEIDALIYSLGTILQTDTHDEYFMDACHEDGSLFVTCSDKNNRSLRIPEVWVQRLLGKRYAIHPIHYGSAPWKDGIEVEFVPA